MNSIKNTLVVSFVSGKGSIGKSTILTLVANQLVKKFSSILIWDNDIYSPLQHILNGVEPNITLMEIITNNISPHKALSKITNQIFLVGGSNRFDIDVDISDVLLSKFNQLLDENDFDIVLVDCHSGFSKIVSNFSKISNITLNFLSDDPTSILDAYGLTKILFKYFGIRNIATVVNNVVDLEDGMEIVNIFNQATSNFLNIKFSNFGIIPYSKDLKKFIFNLGDFLKDEKNKEFLESVNQLAERIVNMKLNENILI
ncbi:hypothetical protein D9V84_05810 [Bacteroidetes/Chlorobi group bacterium Naka2016]|jgi:flagellar biosynthesis protein FlhG|nr:MAG: hypothetical protein D9V84_05810 [Bacteroidetes/Chlorobi group bacterium Naka2016]